MSTKSERVHISKKSNYFHVFLTRIEMRYTIKTPNVSTKIEKESGDLPSLFQAYMPDRTICNNNQQILVITIDNVVRKFSERIGAAGDGLIIGQKLEGPVRTCADTAGNHPMTNPLDTAVTFLHFAVFGKCRSPEGTGHSAAMASDAVCIVVKRQVGIGILINTAGRTGIDTGRVIAVHTGDGIKAVLTFVIGGVPVNLPKNTAKGSFATRNVDIVLIHAGDGA